MKNLILLSFFCLLSCNKAQENKTTPKGFLHNILINEEWQGEKLISDINFINSINSTCLLNSSFFGRSEKQVEEDNLKCVLSRINFDYNKLNQLNSKVSLGKISSSIEIFIKKTEAGNTENADIFNKVILYIEKDKTLSDSLNIYYSMNFIEALAVKERLYYLRKDSIFLTDLLEDESGRQVSKWMNYKIGPDGKIKLIKEKEFDRE